MSQIKKPKRLERSVIYESDWINLYADRVELPSGRILEKHHIIEFPTQAVGVVVENDKNEILFVQVFRYAIDDVNWEIPAGRIEKGETPIEAGQREVREESGFDTFNHKLVYTYFPINGISDETFHIVFCRAGKSIDDFDRDEINDIKWVSKDELRKMLQRQELRDGFSLTAITLYMSSFLE